ncbi:hypothetical protein [Nitrosospira sp. Is2]|uniref:hypothetical protein n=1 Tax=Nitrosospira sp. Is2 TaxID=3080532 RepID=UPI002952BD23|nr:hypothetical protein [Nitrosospira sp. Is2]WON74451.1 hypothetical protein R5L00_02875 [Nitrosospira sp. Is2]
MTFTILIKTKRPAWVRVLSVLFLLALIAPEPVFPTSSSVRDKSRHGEIRQIDQMYDKINAQIGTERLVESQRKFEYCEPYADALRIVHVDDLGIVRHYLVERGSEDSSMKLDSYYDDKGRLRLALIEGRAVNGTLIRYRIYYDQHGGRIHEHRDKVTGPGYPFSSALEARNLVRKPLGSFHAGNPCPEIMDP